MAVYNTLRNGDFKLDNKVIFNNQDNRDYREMRRQVDSGESSIEPYEQSLEDLRQEKKEGIKSEGLRRIQSKVDAIDSVGMAKLIYKHMWPQANASQALLDGEAIYDYAVSKLDQAQGATRDQLNAYDPATDAGWPQ
jgi:hypothetical protein